MEGLPMLKLPIRTWISNAAAVFWGQHVAVTEQAEQSQCSRETVYQHVRKVEERLEQASRDQTRIAEQDAQIERLVQKVAELEAERNARRSFTCSSNAGWPPPRAPWG